jgi:hypothetical protein
MDFSALELELRGILYVVAGRMGYVPPFAAVRTPRWSLLLACVLFVNLVFGLKPIGDVIAFVPRSLEKNVVSTLPDSFASFFIVRR